MAEQLLSDILDEFEEYFDEANGGIVIAGITFGASRILKEVDPMLYRAQFDEWNHFIRPDGEVDTDELLMDRDFPA